MKSIPAKINLKFTKKVRAPHSFNSFFKRSSPKKFRLKLDGTRGIRVTKKKEKKLSVTFNMGTINSDQLHSLPYYFFQSNNIHFHPCPKALLIENKIVFSTPNLGARFTTYIQSDTTLICSYRYKIIRSFRDSIEILRADYNKLANRTYLNDKIINFYLKLLEDHLGTDNHTKVLVFNSFFYTLLAQNGETGSLTEPLLNFESVSRKKADFDIFSFEYLLIPICDNNHWTAVLLKHPIGIQSVFQYDSVFSATAPPTDVPMLFYLDSFYSGRENTKEVNVIRKWLMYEYWKKMDQVPEPNAMEGFAQLIRVHIPVVPKQNNSFDCGVFVLAYAEMFFCYKELFVERLLNETAGSIFDNDYTIEKRSKLKELIMEIAVNQHNAIEKYIESLSNAIGSLFNNLTL